MSDEDALRPAKLVAEDGPDRRSGDSKVSFDSDMTVEALKLEFKETVAAFPKNGTEQECKEWEAKIDSLLKRLIAALSEANRRAWAELRFFLGQDQPGTRQ
jgi:hypothetical protein